MNDHRFMQMPFLPKLTEDDVWVDRKAPNTLVAHARVGNCIGDMGSYDYFSLGGPYRCVRGMRVVAAFVCVL
jgi:hypothetical protein